jgi:hypothetical protein
VDADEEGDVDAWREPEDRVITKALAATTTSTNTATVRPNRARRDVVLGRDGMGDVTLLSRDPTRPPC